MAEAGGSSATRIVGVSRRAFICLICVVLLSLTPAGTASAAPTVTLKASAIPIPGFPGTGDILGAGTEVETTVAISGTEYGGFPSPMTGLNVYAPVGVKLNPGAFATCAAAVLEVTGASGCPKRSSAGPQGIGLGVVAFGGERVPENVSIRQFFAPGGGLTFYVEGRTPASFQVVEPAHWVPASAPFGRDLIVDVPLIETVPGGDDASVLSFTVKVGAAYWKGGKAISYITQPGKCPRGGFPAKMELHFLSGETAVASDKVPCPRH